MIREEEFRISRRPYAVHLSSMRVSGIPNSPRQSMWVGLDAVWFRRRRGTTMAVIGGLRAIVSERPASAVEALRAMVDGRYGGGWIARWDGENYASELPHTPSDIEANLQILRPMLENFPAVPPGYDGWWRY